MTERRLWLRAAAWLAFLGPFFFATYGFANWLASMQTGVGSIAFGWESAIPFVPWTIIPYWSIDLLYAASLFICTTRRELGRHAQRLIFVQLVSVAFFIAYPLRFSFDRPESSGLFGTLFTALGSFDKPFNQAPSLHIGLLIVIWARLGQHCPQRWRWFLHSWMVLIGVSILTTYQHHFIDLPTGLAVGFLALWALPENQTSPLRGLALASDRRRRRLAMVYVAGATACAAFAFLGGAWLWMSWPAMALAIVAMNYLAIGERGFQKGATGRLSAGAQALLAPYLVFAFINSRLWTHKRPEAVEVIDGVWLGRIPTTADLDRSQFAAIVDLSAEVGCGATGDRFYRSIAVLDLTVPTARDLRGAAQAIESSRQHGPVLVCCALGYSRSAAAVAAWLLMTHRAASVDEALRLVRKARPAVVLQDEHCAALEVFA